MNFDIAAVTTNLVNTATQLGLKIAGAIVIWIVGKMVIGFILSILTKALASQRFDSTLVGYMRTGVSVALRGALLLAILGFFGVETSSFAALIAAAGVAIGMAWSGLLANFAAGVFLVVLRPFKKGDFVTAGGVTGTIRSIGLFGTEIDTPDCILTTVGNGKIFSDTIQNFSANPYRRVDLTAQLPNGVDPKAAIELLKQGMSRVANTATAPAPECEILTFTAAGPVLAVRPYTNNSNYWQVYFDTNQMIASTFAAAGYPVPAQQHIVVQASMAHAADAVR